VFRLVFGLKSIHHFSMMKRIYRSIHAQLEKIIAFLRREENFPFVLFLLALFSFGILIPRMGLYSDDWHYFWLSYRLDYIARFFIRNRPYLGSVYDFINNFIDASPLQWQLVLFIFKWTGVTALWLTLKRIFSSDTGRARWICLLFAFYPGNLILFQPLVFIVAVLQINLFFLSFLFTILAVQQPQRKWFFLALALAASLMNLVASEYFFFLELLRPLVIWVALGSFEEQRRARFRRLLLTWLPYLAVFGGAIIWRFLFQNSLSSHQVWLFQDFLKQPFETLVGFFRDVVRSFAQLFITAWNNRLLQDQIYEPQRMGISLYFIALLSVSAWFLFHFFFHQPVLQKKGDQPKKVGDWWLGLTGLAAIFLGGLPIWLSKYSLDFSFRTENRFVLPFFLGISLALVGFTYAVFRDRLTRVFCLTAAVAVGLGFQFLTANLYVQETENLRQYFWQLQWRAPSLQTGIHLVSNPPPFTMEGENSLSAGINWIYGRHAAEKQIDYYLYFNPQRIQKEIGELVRDKPVQLSHQIGEFSGSQLRLLAFQYSPPGCLQLVDPSMRETALDVPAYVGQAAAASDLGLISAQESELNIQRLHQIFSGEPSQDWCYYFEKADLARQMQKWDEIGALYDRLTQMGLRPAVAMEWAPFIEGFARRQQWQAALQLSQRVTSQNPAANAAICILWDRVLAGASADAAVLQQAIDPYLAGINCTTGS
jgi:hypothetical protein